MNIQGLQKLTLLDFPGRVACTVFLGGCDFRCPFCHNFELLGPGCPSLMDDAALLTFLEKRCGLLDGVCITGMLTSAYSRAAEYRADRQAVREGYGAALVTALEHTGKHE